jgi:hypothetical protein
MVVFSTLIDPSLFLYKNDDPYFIDRGQPSPWAQYSALNKRERMTFIPGEIFFINIKILLL